MVNRQHDLVIKKLNEQKRLAGLVSERFPRVSSIIINMKYYRKISDKAFLERTLNFYPTSFAYFFMTCLKKKCHNGCFNLKPMITRLVKNQKKSMKGSMICHCKNGSYVSGELGVAYEISIAYGRLTRKSRTL
jgi:hypothetical protein